MKRYDTIFILYFYDLSKINKIKLGLFFIKQYSLKIGDNTL